MTQTQPSIIQISGPEEAWEMVIGQLQMELSRPIYETWVQPLKPLGYREGVFTLGAVNSYAREWVENRLKSRIVRLLEGLWNEPVTLQVVVSTDALSGQESAAELLSDLSSSGLPVQPPAEAEKRQPAASNRKVMLQRAYGSERARIIQPERGMFLTLYFFSQWLPLIGHSAAATILAARSMCYWNPMTGDLRNLVETDMSELARRAAVSVRTVKDVLNADLVRRYFLRYKVRRVMTPNGVRTAGIWLQVRMDDPLTPSDQISNNLVEDEHWYLPDFNEETD